MSDDQGQDNQPRFGLKAAQDSEATAAPVPKEQMSPQQQRRVEEMQKRKAAERRQYAQKKQKSPTARRRVKVLPAEITSYDLWKFFACMLMLLDHIGLFFFPEYYTWFATFGKMCVPIWMFFIGYARTSKVTDSLFWGMIGLTVIETAMGIPIIPLDMLFGIIVARMMRDYLGEKLFYGTRESYFVTLVSMTLLCLFTPFFWEFGISLCMIMMIGYALRRENELYEKFRSIRFFMYWSTFIFVVVASVRDELIFAQSVVLLLGLLLINRYLIRFTRRKYTKMTRSMPSVFSAMIKFFGRHSLAFYIGHLAILYGIAFYLQNPMVSFMDISFSPLDFEAMQEAVEAAQRERELAPVIRDTNTWEW